MNSILRRRRAVMAQANKGKSDMNGWTAGVAYTDLTVFENSYYSETGNILSYSGWSRTGYVPCHGASSITFSPMQPSSSIMKYNVFVDENFDFIQNFTLSKTTNTVITVPANAYYFGISGQTAPVSNCISGGIIPNK